MSNRIHILPKSVINLISAGEIADNPHSILKELIDNSIDAKSTKIRINIENGGKTLINVIDDGFGINKLDIELAFKNHATSKLSNLDVNTIDHLGFRGEALKSISSVSRVSLSSNDSHELEGNKIIYDNGKFISKELIAMNRGTNISVENLFDVVPARKKFLKKTSIENRLINRLVNKYIFSYPKIAFEYNSSGKKIYNLKATSLINRIQEIYGEDLSKNLSELKYESDSVSITGYIGNNNTLRKSTYHQYYYINNRIINDPFILKQINNSFGLLKYRDEFPFIVLNLNIPFNLIDVNIHPKKDEVSFSNPESISLHINKAISKTINNVLTQTKNIFDDDDKYYINKTQQLELPDTAHINDSDYYDTNERISDITFKNNDEKNITDLNFKTTNFKSDNSNKIFFLQVSKKYIVTEIKSGLIIIDQHVAHERVLYEKALNAFNQQSLSSQHLLFPKTIQLDAADLSVLYAILPYLEKLGFKIREFGTNKYIIESVPQDVKWGSESKIILNILDNVGRDGHKTPNFIDKIAASYACKTAIKAGDRLIDEEMKYLTNSLFQTKEPYFCPHGRPIIYKIGLEDLDSKFERI